jgi:HlyD family secretion protein
MAMKRGRWVTAALLVLFVVLLGVRELHPKESVQVVTGAVSRGVVARRVVATGTLQAVTTVQVGAQVSGTIQELHADFNSIVRAGDVVAKLDPSLFDAALGEAEAALGRAQAAEAQAEADQIGLEAAAGDARTKLARAESLASSDLLPLADLDAARIASREADTDLQGGRSKIGEAKAAVDEARAAETQARVDLDRTVIRSPIDGVVIARSVDVGQTVAAAVQAPVLFTIAADLRALQLEVQIDESDIGGVDTGSRATFKVESYPNETFAGQVSQVRLQPVTEAGLTPTTGAAGTVVSYTTIIQVDNSDERLRPGMTAMVIVPGPRHDNAVRVPNNALSFQPSWDVLAAVGESISIVSSGPSALADPTHRRVWQYDGTTFTPVDVRIGLSDGQWTEVVSGSLEPGDAVVTNASATQ